MGKLEHDARPEWSPRNQNRKVGMAEGDIPVTQLNGGQDYSLLLVISTVSTEEIAQILGGSLPFSLHSWIVGFNQ